MGGSQEGEGSGGQMFGATQLGVKSIDTTLY